MCRALRVLAALVAIEVLGVIASCAQSVNQKDSCSAHADRLPKFRIARDERVGADGLQVFVSVEPTQISQASLLSLGCRLGLKYRDNQFLFVWFFDSYSVAKVWRLAPVEQTWPSQALRGSYSFDRKNGSHELLWFPNKDDHSQSSRIGLGSPPP